MRIHLTKTGIQFARANLEPYATNSPERRSYANWLGESHRKDRVAWLLSGLKRIVKSLTQPVVSQEVVQAVCRQGSTPFWLLSSWNSFARYSNDAFSLSLFGVGDRGTFNVLGDMPIEEARVLIEQEEAELRKAIGEKQASLDATARAGAEAAEKEDAEEQKAEEEGRERMEYPYPAFDPTWTTYQRMFSLGMYGKGNKHIWKPIDELAPKLQFILQIILMHCYAVPWWNSMMRMKDYKKLAKMAVELATTFTWGDLFYARSDNGIVSLDELLHSVALPQLHDYKWQARIRSDGLGVHPLVAGSGDRINIIDMAKQGRDFEISLQIPPIPSEKILWWLRPTGRESVEAQLLAYMKKQDWTHEGLVDGVYLTRYERDPIATSWLQWWKKRNNGIANNMLSRWRLNAGQPERVFPLVKWTPEIPDWELMLDVYATWPKHLKLVDKSREPVFICRRGDIVRDVDVIAAQYDDVGPNTWIVDPLAVDVYAPEELHGIPKSAPTPPPAAPESK